MTTIQAIILGIVEGLTEFIPVSSTGHLILLVDILKFQGPPGKVFEVIIQLGAICAICWVYRKKLFYTAMHLGKRSEQLFAGKILLAFLPASVIGVLAHGYIKAVLFNPTVVSVSLIVGGIAILLIERMSLTVKHKTIEGFSLKLCFTIGLCQTLAMIPGVSRSGATIMGALLLGAERKAATEFSFFLAIPTMLGATVYDIYKNYNVMSMDNVQIILIGFVSAFIAALFVVRSLIAFISTHGFTPFGWYRIAVGSLMLALLYV